MAGFAADLSSRQIFDITIAEGDKVVSHWTYRWMDESLGKQIDMTGMDIYPQLIRAGVEIYDHCPLARLSLRLSPSMKRVLTPSGKLYYYLVGSQYATTEKALRVCGVA